VAFALLSFIKSGVDEMEVVVEDVSLDGEP
jgi:hypothetical protein